MRIITIDKYVFSIDDNVAGIEKFKRELRQEKYDHKTSIYTSRRI